MISIIIPTLNEEDKVETCLKQFSAWRTAGHEVILVDGGSVDASVALAQPLVDKVLLSLPGRAAQMNLGADTANGDLLWFVHIDSVIPQMAKSDLENLSTHQWGRFNIRLEGSAFIFRIIEKTMNIRSCITGIATGDQGIFVCRDLFDEVDGFDSIALMEDIALSKKLKQKQKIHCVKSIIKTSTRRWQQQGIYKTIVKMWFFRLAYFFGVSPDWIVKKY